MPYVEDMDVLSKRAPSMARSFKHQLALLVVVALLASCSSFSKKGAGKSEPRPQSRPSAPSAVTPTPSAPATVKADPQTRFNEALQMMREKRLQEAEAAFATLSIDAPQYSGPWANLGIIYAKSNRREQALAALSKATSLNDRNAVAWNWLGLVQRELGDRSKAEQAYLRALAVKPDYALPHLNLGILYDTYLSRPQDALAHYRQYQKLAGKEDLRIVAWIAEIESKQAVAAPAQQPGQTAPSPAAQKAPGDAPAGSLLPVRKP
jgi:tetratricopeptide (TPR) repeat protein